MNESFRFFWKIIFARSLANVDELMYNKHMSRRRKERKEKNFAVADNSQSISASKATNLDAKQVMQKFEAVVRVQRKQKNNLLGSFNGEKYEISDDMKEKLIALPKKFDRIEDNTLYCATVFDTFVLNFKIEMDISESYCTGKLFIIEIEQGIDEDIKHVTQLAEIVEPYKFEFRDELCQKWNVVYVDAPLEKEDPVNRYLRLQNEEFLFYRELTEILSQLYFLRMLSLLDKLGENGAKVKADFKLSMEKFLKADPSLSQNFTFQMELLNNLINKENLFAEILSTEEGKKIVDGFSTPLDNIQNKRYPSVMKEAKFEIPKQEQKKVETKPTVKKKSSPAKAPKPFSYSYKSDKFEGPDDAIEFAPPELSMGPQPTVAPVPQPAPQPELQPAPQPEPQSVPDLPPISTPDTAILDVMSQVNELKSAENDSEMENINEVLNSTSSEEFSKDVENSVMPKDLGGPTLDR